MTLWNFTAREVKNRPGRAILTLLSIVIGVAAVVSVSLATSTTRKAYRDMLRAVHGKANLVLSGNGGASFDGALLEEVEKTAGITAAAASVQESVEMRYSKKGPDGKVLLDETGDPVRAKLQSKVLGIDVARDKAIREFEVVQALPEVAAGNWFTGPATVKIDNEEIEVGSLAIDESISSSLRLSLGDVVRLGTRRAGRAKLSEQRITAIVKPKEGAAVSAGAFIFLDLPVAQRLCRTAGQIDFIHIVTDEKVPIETVQATLDKRLSEIPAASGLTLEKAGINTRQAEESLLPVEEGLRLATSMTLVLAAFIILNTFMMNVGERRRQLAIMRAIGATRGQVIRLLLKEGLLMGMIGCVLGIALGSFGAYYLTKAMANLFQTKLVFAISWLPCLLGVVFGMGLSLIGVYFPSRKAGKLSPLEGMARVALEDQHPSTSFWSTLKEGFTGIGQTITGHPPKHTDAIWPVVGLMMVLICGSILFGCIRGVIPMYFAVTTSVGLMIGIVLMLPTVLQPITRFATALTAPVLGAVGNLAGGQLLRRRTRTALTIGVLFIAMALGIAVGSGVIDAVSDVHNWYRNTLVADFFVRSTMPDPNGDTVPMSEEFCQRLYKLAEDKSLITGLETSRYISRQYLDLKGYPKAREEKMMFTVITRDFVLGDKPNLNLTSGDPVEIRNQLLAGEVVVGTVLAQRAGLSVGDELPLITKENKVQRLKIAALVNDYMVSGMIAYMSNDTASKWLESKGIAGFAVDVNKNRKEEAGKQLRALTQEYGLIFQTYGEIAHTIDGMVDGAVSGQWMILVLGFVVSGFGIVNTLTMNVLEQTRELGLLRIVAMTRNQIRRLILSQAALIGFLGLAPGILAGLSVSWLLNRAMLPVIGHPIPMQFHPYMMLGSFGIGLVIVVVSAMFPAERAARIELATALQYE